MQVLKRATRRRAGIAAAVMMAGGLAGTVLMTGTALADTPAVTAPAATSTAVTGASQFTESWGTLGLQVDVSVTNTSNGAGGTATTAPTGTFKVSDGSSTCSGTLTTGSGLTSTGSCHFDGVTPQTYNLVAGYTPADATFSGSVSASFPFTVTSALSAPQWTADNPPLSATSGSEYAYDFQANGNPPATYSLCGCGTNWLSINPATGEVYGKVPYGITSFTYRVTASNSQGSISHWVAVQVSGGRHFSSVSTQLSCPTWLVTGERGTCTLYVTNDGWSQSNNVDAQITLPSQLRADYCNSRWGYSWGWGCSISGNVASEDLGTLNPGETREMSVTFTAGTPSWIWGYHQQRPDHVTVIGSASENNGWGWYQRNSYSDAHITIYPRWW